MDSKQLRLQHLNAEQVREVYHERMKEDFPPSELKPLEMIEQSVQRGIYECLGLFENGQITAYVYLIRMNRIYLADYIAVYPAYRDRGYGTCMLGLLSRFLNDADLILAEVEVPSEADTAAEREIRSRRLDFYTRAGLINTGIRVSCFGVPFLILTFPGRNIYTQEKIKEYYQDVYRLILPPGLFENNMRILGDCSAGERGE